MERTIETINERMARGEAVVLTAQELERLVEEGRDRELRDVDVVTTGTMGLMSGTYALLSFPIARPGVHRRFVKGTLNGVPMHIGPCPNEGLGMVDCMVFGTSHSAADPHYGGGHLFRDLVEGKAVQVDALTDDGRELGTEVTLSEIPTARLMGSRNLFRNYRAFVNPSNKEVSSIFHSAPLPPNWGGMTFSGCGHLNPLQNDLDLRTIGIGTRVLFNGGEGFITGAGTRSSASHPNLMTIADMKGMDPTLMGGFQTAEGPECIVSYAVPIPILDDRMLENVTTMDYQVPVAVVDVRDRHAIAETTYDRLWGRDEATRVDRSACIRCQKCDAEIACPTGAIVTDDRGPSIDTIRCFNCGACVLECHQQCFLSSLGTVRLDIDGSPRMVPIIGRGSNREGARRTMEDLRKRILEGRFPITPRVADIRP